MTEVSLDGAGIDALVGQLVAARVPEHVRMELHIEARRAAGALDHPLKATGGERCTALADKQERRAASLPLQPSQSAQLAAGQWMRCR